MKQKLYPSSRLAKLYKKELLKVVFKKNYLKTHSLCDMPKDNMNSKKIQKASKSHIMVNSVDTIRFLNE